MRPALLLAGLLAFAGQAAEFSTFIGDSSDYRVARIQADSAGNTYIGGSRTGPGGASEIFVMKLDGTGNIILFRTLSGKGSDSVNDLAVDSAGDLYVAGATTSPNLPLQNAYQTSPGPGFIAKFSADGNQLTLSTYFPAEVQSLALDTAGNIYVTGSTNSPAFPVTAGLPAGKVSAIGSIGAVSGAFITKLSAAGDRIVYSALIVGNNKPCGCCSSCFLSSRSTLGVSIAVDAAGNAFVAGNTDTSDIPTTAGALLATGTGAFVAKVNAAGTALGYLTYIGPTNYPQSPSTHPANTAKAIAVDAAGNAYVTGSTFDPQFPASAGAYQSTLAGGASDAFVAKINPDGTGVVWATYLGGGGADVGNALSVDAAGNVWLAGSTQSADFPNAQGWSQGEDFVVEVNAAGSKLTYAARYPNGAASQSVAVDMAGTVHFAGPAGLVSTLTPGATPPMRIFGVANSAYGGAGGRLAPGELISIYGPHIGPATAATVPVLSNGVPTTGYGPLQVMALEPGAPQIALPLLYVSDSQINAVLPYNVSGRVNLRIVNNTSTGISSPDFPVTLAVAAPEIFQNTDGTAVAVNQDGIFNSAEHPAPPGSVVSIWVTGVGFFSGGATAGAMASGAHNAYCCTVNFDELANVLYGGDTPGTVGGVVQINFQVPLLLPYVSYPAAVEFTVGAGGATSHAAIIHVGG